MAHPNDCWLQTYSGLIMHPFNPRLEDITLGDIAHSLSLLCRYNGHCACFYSVAQHSVLVSRVCPPEDTAWGLMHDASEAYLGDMLSPMKHGSALGWEYQKVEGIVQRVIINRFNLSVTEPQSVKQADRILLATEKRDLLCPSNEPWPTELPPPMDDTIYAEPWWLAKESFLKTAESLGIK